MEKKQFIVTIFSENTVGLLNQISIIFTRRQLNIETLSVSPSAIEGVHKFTITTVTDRETIEKVVKQIDKRIDILKAYFNTPEELIVQEVALYKLSTTAVTQQGAFEPMLRKHNARVLEITPDFIVLERTGTYEQTQALFAELSQGGIGVLQFIRSGIVAITRSKVERLTDMLNHIERRIQSES